MNTQLVLKRIIVIAICFSLLVIALGAYTRLVHAGLGCPDWPLCYGHAWAPSSGEEINRANLAFPEIPVDLTKTWPEMTHRYLASSLGLLCIVIVMMGFKVRRQLPSFPFKHSLFLLCFVILQGLFGMWTVTLKLWPQVVTLHLLGGFTTLCLLLLLYLRGFRNRFEIELSRWLRPLAATTLVIVFIQIALGGWVTSNYAALACTQLPLCNLSSLSGNDVAMGFNILQEIGPNYLGGQLDGGARIAIHMSHRIGALIATLCIIALIVMLWRIQLRKHAIALLALLVVQVSLGILNVWLHLPLSNAVAHNLFGALLLACVVWINWRVHPNHEKDKISE